MKNFFKKLLYKILPIEDISREVEKNIANQLFECKIDFRKDDTDIYACSASWSYSSSNKIHYNKILDIKFVRAHSAYEAASWFREKYITPDPDYKNITNREPCISIIQLSESSIHSLFS